MIKNFVHKGLEKLFEEDDRSGINPEHEVKLSDILDRLDSALEVKDMNYPGSGLHQLKGQRKGEWAVKVSGNWRVIFEFQDGNAYNVNYVDYH